MTCKHGCARDKPKSTQTYFLKGSLYHVQKHGKGDVVFLDVNALLLSLGENDCKWKVASSYAY